MNPGSLDQRVAFSRRTLVDGLRTGDALEIFHQCWARWRPGAARQLPELGQVSDAVDGTLTIRDVPVARGIATQDRVTLRGQDLEVISAPIPDRSGFLAIQVTRRLGGT